MKIINLFLLCIIAGFIQAQNLVPNPGFDNIPDCSPTTNVLHCSDWYKVTRGTPDNFDSCFNGTLGAPENAFGYQVPHSNSGYAGLMAYSYSNYREYLGTTLLSPLLAGQLYNVDFYVSLADYTTAIKSIGMYFSDTLVLDTANQTVLSVTPQLQNSTFLQDTLGWMHLSFQHVANGGEQYIVIGNFNTNANTDTIKLSTHAFAYYYIDDVSIVAGNDTTYAATHPGFTEITLAPNPGNGEFYLRGHFPADTRWEVVDMLGKILYAETIEDGVAEKRISLGLANGMYLYRIYAGKEIMKSGKFIIAH